MWIFWIGVALNQILMAGLGIMLPAMRAEMGFGLSQAGTLRAIGGTLTALFSIPLNAWVTRFPSKLVMGLFIAGMGLAYLANGLAPSYPVLLVARGVGMLISMSMLAVIVLIQNQWFSLDQMGTINGIRLGMVSAGQIVALAGVPILMANFGSWRGVYYITAAAMIPVVVAWFLLARENRTPEYEARMAAQAEAGSPIGAALKRKEFILLGVGIMGATIVYVAFLTFWPTYAIEERGLALTECGPVMSVVAVGSMIASSVAGVLSDKIGLRRPQPFIAGLLLPVACFAMLQFSSVGILTAIAFIVGFGIFIFWPVVFTIPYELKGISPQETAVGIGVILAIINAGAALGVQLAGIMIKSLGMYKTLALLCVTPLLLSVCTIMLPETGPRARAKAASKMTNDQ